MRGATLRPSSRSERGAQGGWPSSRSERGAGSCRAAESQGPAVLVCSCPRAFASCVRGELETSPHARPMAARGAANRAMPTTPIARMLAAAPAITTGSGIAA